MAKDTGTLETGKFADLIAATKDPLKNIKELESVDFVIKGAEVFKLADWPGADAKRFDLCAAAA